MLYKAQPLKILNSFENRIMMKNQRIVNDLGLQVDMTSLTALLKTVTEQKFYQIPFADYVPTPVGDGAFSSYLLKYRSFELSGEFEDGIIDTGANNTRLASADTGVDSVTVPVKNWAKTNGWTLLELEQASRAGNWDIVTSKEKSRKKNWDLGLQRVCFLGAKGLNSLGGTVKGLLNQTGITVNTSVITQPISSLNPADLKTFCANVFEAYRQNSARTAYPTHFIIPESDYNGLASQSSPEFPIKTVLQILLETFKTVTHNDNFKILPVSYGDMEYSGLPAQCYVMLNYDEDSLQFNIPVDYTNTLANSLDNFMFQNVAYGQFTGVAVYRPREMLYFQYTPA